MKLSIPITIIAGLACVTATGLVGVHHNSQAKENYHTQYNIERDYHDKYQNDLAKKSARLSKKIKYQHDNNYSQWENNEFFHQRLDNITQSFFENYYDFKTRQEATARPANATKYATKNVTHNTGLFLYSTDIHNNIGSKLSSLDNYIVSRKKNLVTDIVDVQYLAWFTKGSHSNQPNTGEKWFKVTYDTNTNKLTSVQPFYREDNIHTNDFKL